MRRKWIWVSGGSQLAVSRNLRTNWTCLVPQSSPSGADGFFNPTGVNLHSQSGDLVWLCFSKCWCFGSAGGDVGRPFVFWVSGRRCGSSLGWRRRSSWTWSGPRCWWASGRHTTASASRWWTLCQSCCSRLVTSEKMEGNIFLDGRTGFLFASPTGLSEDMDNHPSSGHWRRGQVLLFHH